MNKKKTMLVCLSTAAIALSSFGIANSLRQIKAETDIYTLQLFGSSNKYTGGATENMKTQNGNNVGFEFSDCEVNLNANNFITLNPGSYFRNTTPINGIYSIESDGSVSGGGTDYVYYRYSVDGVSWSDYAKYNIFIENSLETPANYLEISLSNETDKQVGFNMSIFYTCKAAESSKYNPADYYDGYYASIESWTDGEDLKEQLHDVISSNYTSLTYDDANWDSNTDADHIKDNYFYVDGVYSADDIRSANTGKGWQREHAWCASLMTGSTTGNAIKYLGRATDFHNLFAGGASGNMSRGNKNFGYADTSSTSYKNFTVNDGYDGYSYDNKNFEPGDKDKGRLARALFYMATRYTDVDNDTVNGVAMQGLEIVENYVDFVSGNDCKFQIGNLSDLLEWNSFPVDELEMQHNVSVYTHAHNGFVQGNRNPYVDYPGLVDYVYGSKKDEAGRLEDIKPSAVDLDANSDEHRNYTIASGTLAYTYGETFSDDLVIYDVKKDFTKTVYSGAHTSSLAGHTFAMEDGSSIQNTVTVGEETLKYDISLTGLKACSYYYEIKKGSLVNTIVNADQNTTWTSSNKTGSVDWLFNVSAPSGFTWQNQSAGGTKLGSGTKAVSKVTMTTKNSYKVNQVYFSGTPANADSSYVVTIYVGSTQILSKTMTNASKEKLLISYGGAVDNLEGQIKIEVSGTNAIILGEVAFNIVED